MRRRPTQPMPEDIAAMLEASGLTAAYAQRPFYQRNDYLSWIGRAKRPETRERRITQMLEELKLGGVYMGMTHPASKRPNGGVATR